METTANTKDTASTILRFKNFTTDITSILPFFKQINNSTTLKNIQTLAAYLST